VCLRYAIDQGRHCTIWDRFRLSSEVIDWNKSLDLASIFRRYLASVPGVVDENRISILDFVIHTQTLERTEDIGTGSVLVAQVDDLVVRN
jgi:hypothetical protein